MHNHKPQKIDLDQTYPCPCPRKRGKLKPIALTDAFGCDRCSLMFELELDGYSLSQLGGIDNQRRTWQWIGKWQAIQEHRAYSILEMALAYLSVWLLIGSTILWVLSFQISLGFPIIILLFILVGLLIWRLLLLYRRDSE